jgi:phosphoribosyl 1,2-cyclic phosphodiesterase
MGLRYTSLGSGSEGNALVVEAVADDGQVRGRVLLDCGFGARELTRRLQARGLAPEQFDAVLVTHEHADHLGSAYSVAQRHQVCVMASHGTMEAANDIVGQQKLDTRLQRRLCSHASFALGELEIHPFPVPHDAAEPTQFVFVHGDTRLGVLTDVGTPTPHIAHMLSACDGLVLEANHDPQLLHGNAQYPASLKRRIAGQHGHLSNEAAAQILAAVDKRRLKHLHAAHLSQQNNDVALVLESFRGALAAGACPALGVATQEQGFEWVSLL